MMRLHHFDDNFLCNAETLRNDTVKCDGNASPPNGNKLFSQQSGLLAKEDAHSSSERGVAGQPTTSEASSERSSETARGAADPSPPPAEAPMGVADRLK